ncbi:high-affinity branched-chain amino acid ABC transporter permease LivM [Magnetofaba australis]|uniref:Putative inner-membrane translocator n=1 Tax=Magnetofaba australis IT-1 TaxID=1434232 RepID=A0A1Y2K158_9PROT|nr:high-affinity branched-chain amino acid ABC transporter permease LivM [Magnetofaba australis]OSM01771.1 putative inner-membrane translocator [Magnetofaba australis IT-1]
MSNAAHSWKGVLNEAARAGAAALLLFGPIVGLTLSGYELESHWSRAFILAGVVFVGRFVIAALFLHPRLGPWLERRFTRSGPAVVVDKGRRVHHVILTLLVIATAFALPFMLSKYWITVAILALIYVLLGLGLNIVVGLAGLLDLGFVAFYAVGAYGYALGHQYLGLSFWEALPFSAFLAALFGMVLGFPVLRMHGDYLAIVTLGFGEIIRLALNNWAQFTGGPNGVSAPAPTLFGIEFTRRAKQGGTPYHEFFGQWFDVSYNRAARYVFLYLALLVVVLALIHVVQRLRKMPIGRAWEALREDEIACRSLGINHVTVKLSAFATGAMVGGVGGVFFAGSQGFVNPTSFTFFESALILAIVVLGGLGSVVGVIIAAVTLTVLPELLREFAAYRVLLFGLAMVVMMTWRPRGLLKLRRPSFALPKSTKSAPEAQS